MIYLLFRRLRLPLLVLVIVYAISVLGFVLIPGQDNEGNVWRMSFFHAFYFVSFMGSTIGFGEIPYEFTDQQRFWALFAIYGTVIAWLYGIGTTLNVLGDPVFKRLMTENSFARRVKRLSEPFYIICGYGDTGSLLTRRLAAEGIRVVILDQNPDTTTELETTEFRQQPYGLIADASRLRSLRLAGLESPLCQGVIALTDHDQTNLTIAAAVHLINPRIRLIAKAESQEAELNIASFGKNITVNPFRLFAEDMQYLIHRRGMYTLLSWLTGIPDERLAEPKFPQQGAWILCGYDNFGRSIHEKLNEQTTLTVITPKEEDLIYLENSVKGVGVRADALEAANIRSACGIIAGTANDADNLSIILTAREITKTRKNPLYVIARQNQRFHSSIFDEAEIDFILQRGDRVARRIFALLRSPLVSEFLNHACSHNDDWALRVVSRLAGVLDDAVPHLWEFTLNDCEAKAITKQLNRHRSIKLQDIMRSPRDRHQTLGCLPLLLIRDTHPYLMPNAEQRLKPYDRLLFCGNAQAKHAQPWLMQDDAVLHYILTGQENNRSYIGRWLSQYWENRQARKS